MKKDVQLFLFWALQYAEGMRRDISVAAHGLSGSPWYIENMKEQDFPVNLGPLKDGAGFSILSGKPRQAGLRGLGILTSRRILAMPSCRAVW